MTRRKKVRSGTGEAEGEGAAAQPDSVVDSLLDPYRIAEMVWSRGLSANAILDEFKMPHSQVNQTRVRRAILKAAKLGILQLHPVTCHDLREKLCATFPTLTGSDIRVDIDRTAACLAAARAINQAIEEFLRKPLSSRSGDSQISAESVAEMTIANAGGRTVRDTVECLQRLVPVPPPMTGKKLKFLSLNGAEDPERFGECANYLAVKMAEVYGGGSGEGAVRHLASIRPPMDRSREEKQNSVTNDYQNALHNIDLLVTSAGAVASQYEDKGGFLSHWLQTHGRELPRNVVGDIAFHPINARGEQVDLSKDIEDLLKDKLLLAPEWSTLETLFHQRKVLLILVGEKPRVGRALIESGRANRCIFDAHLAMALTRRASL
jgi:DNA-binding transcriptional regulator LsrR (DeoR family)